MFIGGTFGIIGGQARRNLASLDSNTGNANTWNPSPSGPVNSLAFSVGKIYAGGSFDSCGGAIRNGFASIDSSTGSVAAQVWNTDPGTVVKFKKIEVKEIK